MKSSKHQDNANSTDKQSHLQQMLSNQLLKYQILTKRVIQIQSLYKKPIIYSKPTLHFSYKNFHKDDNNFNSYHTISSAAKYDASRVSYSKHKPNTLMRRPYKIIISNKYQKSINNSCNDTPLSFYIKETKRLNRSKPAIECFMANSPCSAERLKGSKSAMRCLLSSSNRRKLYS